MTYLPWWAGGVALASVMLLHWLLTRRMMAVSGRFTALVDRVRFGPPKNEAAEMTDAELIAAMQELTAEAFGPDAVKPVEPEALAAAPALDRATQQTSSAHLVFLGGLALGGLISALAAGAFSPSFSLHGDAFARLTGGSPLRTVGILFVGGLFVGAGTRMAGGCTSGHGLCGVSRFQPGSLAATAAFFGAGIAVSLLLGRLM